MTSSETTAQDPQNTDHQSELKKLRQQVAKFRKQVNELEVEKQDLELLLEVHTSHSDSVADDLLNQVEDTLRESAKRFRLIAEATPVPVVLSRQKDGLIIYANRLAGVLVNVSVEELLEHNILTYYHNPQDRESLVEELKDQGYVKDAEVQLKKVDGTLLWVSASIQPLTYDNEPCLLTVLFDLTERKQAEEERARLFAMQQELDFAHQIQASLLPDASPNWPALDVVCYSTPARDVGGDFYTYHAFGPRGEGLTAEPPNQHCIAVGDVSGKGMPAALLMAISYASLEATINRSLSPGDLLAYLDQAIAPHTRKVGQNCALCYIDLETLPGGSMSSGASHIMRVANAGCVEPIIRRANGEVYWVEVGGMPLGIGLGATLGYQEQIVTLNSGDLIVLSSDGLVEAKSTGNVIFGFDRLENAVANGPTSSAAAMLSHLQAQIDDFTGQAEMYDDVTIVVIQV
ncbi:MAG: SpoIIE family protein phosphatase [Chloroflexota bacterium]